MNAATQQTQVFQVVVNIKDYVMQVVNAGRNSDTEQATALQRFVQYSADCPNVIASLSAVAQGTEDKTIKSRVSELKCVYQACQHGFTVGEGKGYHETVKAAREVLKEKGILPNGKARKTEEEKAKAKRNSFILQAMKDGLEIEEAVAKYEQEQQSEADLRATLDDAAQALLVEFGHKLAREVAKRVLELTKDSDKAPAASTTL